jgi:hypothetical protein
LLPKLLKSIHYFIFATDPRKSLSFSLESLNRL